MLLDYIEESRCWPAVLNELIFHNHVPDVEPESYTAR